MSKVVTNHLSGGRDAVMSNKDDEKPLILILWLLFCLSLVVAKAAGAIDAPWGFVTFPLWAPLLLGILAYAFLGE